jgi:Sec-independent protein translocase protein TatA
VATVQASGLFGLGAAEIAIIAVAAAFLLGPQKLAELGRDAGKVAGELKEVPKEFQKGFSAGLDEGETEARSRKAKPMARIPPEVEKGSSEPDDSTPP